MDNGSRKEGSNMNELTTEEINYLERQVDNTIIWLFNKPQNQRYVIRKMLQDTYLKGKGYIE
jgi:hypothetical protein